MLIKSSDLLDFYYKRLYPELQKLEQERLEVRKRLIFIFVVIGVTALFYLVNYHDGAAIYGTFIITVTSGGFAYFWLSSDYRRRFKDRIFRQLIAKIDPSLQYDPDGLIPYTLFKQSELFVDAVDSYKGSDLIQGKIGKTPLMFSYLDVKKKRNHSRQNNSRIGVFVGTFIVTEFHKNFHHTVKVYPDLAEKYLGVAGSWFQGSESEKVVRMDSPAFEKEFKVIADDPVEAHYLLTPNIMEKVVQLRKRADAPIYLSFCHNKLFIAVLNGENWFKVPVFESLFRMNVVKQYIQSLGLVFGIVEELHLNRRIWSKA